MRFDFAEMDLDDMQYIVEDVKPFSLDYEITEDWKRDGSHDHGRYIIPKESVATDMLLKHIGRDVVGLWRALFIEVCMRYAEELDRESRRVND